MNQKQIDAFIMANDDNFTAEHKIAIRQFLETMSEEKYVDLLAATNHLKNPSFYWCVSWFCGLTGLDRFLVGDIGLGILKQITMGGFLIWGFIDLFLIKNKVREQNYLKIRPYLV